MRRNQKIDAAYWLLAYNWRPRHWRKTVQFLPTCRASPCAHLTLHAAFDHEQRDRTDEWLQSARHASVSAQLSALRPTGRAGRKLCRLRQEWQEVWKFKRRKIRSSSPPDKMPQPSELTANLWKPFSNPPILSSFTTADQLSTGLQLLTQKKEKLFYSRTEGLLIHSSANRDEDHHIPRLVCRSRYSLRSGRARPWAWAQSSSRRQPQWRYRCEVLSIRASTWTLPRRATHLEIYGCREAWPTGFD